MNEKTPQGANDVPREDEVQEVPAGRAGADSGAADAVRVTPDDETGVPDRSAHNDEPGVGPRRGRDEGRR